MTISGFFSSALESFTSFLTDKAAALLNPHHEMKDHTFTPSEYGAGKLYYQGDVPVLELQSDNPREAGKAHGYLMAPIIQSLFNKIAVASHFITVPNSKMYPRTVAEIKKRIPEEYLEEMDGLIEGYYERLGKSATPVTVDDLITYHLMPDIQHFSLEDSEKNLTPKEERPKRTKIKIAKKTSQVGCTVLVHQDAKTGLIVGRNMDWNAYGSFGTNSLIINRKYTKKITTVEIGFAGFIGTITGMNSEGVTISENVCNGTTSLPEGTPACFVNRKLLETAKTAHEVQKKLKKITPLGPYHLTVTGPKEAYSLHLCQGPENGHFSRRFDGKKPLVVTNCRYTPKGRQVDHIADSKERDELVQNTFQDRPSEPKLSLIKELLATDPINNDQTVHSCVMIPGTKELIVAFDNKSAGARPLHIVDTTNMWK